MIDKEKFIEILDCYADERHVYSEWGGPEPDIDKYVHKMTELMKKEKRDE